MGNKQAKTRRGAGGGGEGVALKEAEEGGAGSTTTAENGSTVSGRKWPEHIPFDKYVFPFENVVFEGGGNKGLAYCGAVRVLEEAGVWRQVKRLAGCSAGAMTAALLSVGYNSHDLQRFLSQDLSKIFVDHKCGYCSLLPNVRKYYGWNPGKKLFAWFGARLKDATGNADITFMEVYEKYEKELCIIVTNVNQMSTEYCHPKTTPNMPVRLAVRMSMAIPGMFEAVPYRRDSYTDYYVDGGVLCNYPIHCFDGWWLSMEPEDGFFRRLHPLTELPRLYEKQERFGQFNPKTLGFVLYNENEPEILQVLLESREGRQVPDSPPDTKLARKRVAKIEARKEAAKRHDTMAAAVDKLLKVLHDNDLDVSTSMNRDEIKNAINRDGAFTEEDLQVLFGENATVEDIFTQLDKDKTGKISYRALSEHLEQKGLNLQARFLGCQRREVGCLADFAQCLEDALLLNTKRMAVESRDVPRTVGINTYYVGTMDFRMEPDDRSLLVEQGKRATRSFLLYYLMHCQPCLRTDDKRRSYCPDDVRYYADDELPEVIDANDYSENIMEKIL